MSFTPYLNFLTYGFTATVLLLIFMTIYVWVTPYNEWQEIKDGNTAVAISFSGAMLGFLSPILSALYFTHSHLEMMIWALAAGVIQLLTFIVLQKLRGIADSVHSGNIASAILLASASISLGLINAISISY